MKTPSFLSLLFLCEPLKVAPCLDTKQFNFVAKLRKFRVVKPQVSLPNSLESFCFIGWLSEFM